MRKRACVAVAAAIGITGVVAPASQLAVHADSFVVRGTVVRDVTGEPLAGVSIGVSHDGLGEPRLFATTGPDGEFEIPVMSASPSPTGTYRVDATDPNERYGSEFVTVDSSPGVKQVAFELGEGGVIVGSVYGLVDDELVPGACVGVTDLSGNPMTTQPLFTNCTQGAGRYRTTTLQPGDYLVSVTPPEFPLRYRPIVGAPVTVVAGQDTEFNIALETVPASIITGQVVDAVSEEPLAGIMIENLGAVWTTDSNGNFTADVTGRTVDGTFDLYVFDPSGSHATRNLNVSVQPGYPEAIVIELEPSGRVEGSLTGEDGLVFRFRCFQITGLDAEFFGIGCTDFNGDFSFGRLGTGAYEMYIPGSYPYASMRVGPIHVVAGQVTNADTVVPLAHTRITGEVIDARTGLPVEGVDVRVRAISGFPEFTLTTDDAGEFSVDVLPWVFSVSSFQISVSDPSGRYVAAGPFDVVVQYGYDEAIGIGLNPIARYSATFTPNSVDPPPTLNFAKVGSVVNMTWTIRDGAGLVVDDRDVVDSVTFFKARCTDFRPMTASKPASGTGRGVTVNRADQFKFGWRAPAGAGCYLVTIELDGGGTLTARFRLRT